MAGSQTTPKACEFAAGDNLAGIVPPRAARTGALDGLLTSVGAGGLELGEGPAGLFVRGVRLISPHPRHGKLI